MILGLPSFFSTIRRMNMHSKRSLHATHSQTEIDDEDDRSLASIKRHRSTEPTLYTLFAQGDLVFGLSTLIGHVHKELSDRGFTSYTAESLNAITIDNIYNKSIDRLEEPKRSHRVFLNRHRDYLFKPGGKPLPPTPTRAMTNQITSSSYRRACKLLINNRDEPSRRRIHILTTGVDWQRVFKKFNADGTIDAGITNSELRSAFRDWFKNGVNPRITFYDADLKPFSQLPWLSREVAPLTQYYKQALAAKRIIHWRPADYQQPNPPAQSHKHGHRQIYRKKR